MSPCFETFRQRAEAVAAEVHRFASKDDAIGFVTALLRAEGVADEPGAYAIWADGDWLDNAHKRDISRRVPGLHFDVSRETAAQAKVGVTAMDWAIADSGTLVHDATALESRLASTLPEIHIALVPTDKLLPDMAAALHTMSFSQHGYISMITGPSRTADIERVLTIGVHGPRRLIVVFVDALGERHA